MRALLTLLGLSIGGAAASGDLCKCDMSAPCQHEVHGTCQGRDFPIYAPEGGVCAQDHFDCGVQKPVYPRKYKASFNLVLPYVNLVENAVTEVDMDRGLQRLSYYDDQDVFIYNASSPSSFEIVPVINTRTCFIAGGSAPTTVFPILDKFKLKASTQLVNNKVCHEWFLDQEELDENGYIGTYSLFADKDGVPVSFAFHGHNVIASGSHFDDYVVDYTSISTVNSFPESTWAPPADLTCQMMELDDDDGAPGPKLAGAEVAPSPSNPLHDLHLLHPEGAAARADAFNTYTKDHDKHTEYAQSSLDTMEIAQKQSNFHASLRYVNSMNRQRLGYTLGVNHMADWSHQERQRLNGRQTKPSSSPGALKIHHAPRGAAASLPDNVDWRDYGAVTRVKDQGTCGSCWTYGTTGTIEGQYFLKYGKMLELSQQSLVDCAWSTGNHACDGGLDSQGYDWIVGNKGVPSAAAYGQYMSMDGYCHVKKDMEMAHIRGYVNVTVGDYDSFNHALATVGPLSISINATPTSFYFYKGGLYDNKECTQDLDHTVLAVGYKTVNGKKYTIVKNSWSMAWGDEGYVMIAQEGDICGVSQAGSYALLQE